MKRLKQIDYLLIVFFAMHIVSCSKTKNNKPLRLSTVNPFQKYLSDNSSQAVITTENNNLPLELGYSFISSDTGSVYQLGIRLPDTAKTYTVTLWDSATQKILAQKNILCATSGFNYIDLSATGESVEIQANHSYVIGVYLTPVNLPGAGPADFFVVQRMDRANIFPFTEQYITYNFEYSKTADSPAFPDNLSEELDVIDGIVDIGFSRLAP